MVSFTPPPLYPRRKINPASTGWDGQDSVLGIAIERLVTGRTVCSLNPGIGEISPTLSDRPWGPLSFLYNGYRVSFPVIKQPGRDADHPSPSTAEVKENVELYFCSPSVPSRQITGLNLPFIHWVDPTAGRTL
jgi:hypothetical protein